MMLQWLPASSLNIFFVAPEDPCSNIYATSQRIKLRMRPTKRNRNHETHVQKNRLKSNFERQIRRFK
jgi:hypothetical protein